ncbi:TrmH family RNA methyltransferase [Candidatus Gottesmanbacteria bacterium]|nr:TrmH family RNA methyltransferase [Candidatus Gottesmanbacteria bacterium]
MIRLKASELRTTQDPDPEVIKKIHRNPIFIICDNVLDTYNVGAIFRLADAVAAEKVFLCGETEIPPNPKIKKASINTWKWVEWEYVSTTMDAISKLKNHPPAGGSNLKVIAVEQHKNSIPISKLKVGFPVAVVIGNETYGVSKEVLNIADIIVELPMFGVNTSLNVMVSCGIVLYKIIEQLKRSSS